MKKYLSNAFRSRQKFDSYIINYIRERVCFEHLFETLIVYELWLANYISLDFKIVDETLDGDDIE